MLLWKLKAIGANSGVSLKSNIFAHSTKKTQQKILNKCSGI